MRLNKENLECEEERNGIECWSITGYQKKKRYKGDCVSNKLPQNLAAENKYLISQRLCRPEIELGGSGSVCPEVGGRLSGRAAGDRRLNWGSRWCWQVSVPHWLLAGAQLLRQGCLSVLMKSIWLSPEWAIRDRQTDREAPVQCLSWLTPGMNLPSPLL